MTQNKIRPNDHDINTLLKLFNEEVDLTYDTDGNLVQITITTKDSREKQKTITFDLQYDDEGNLIKIVKNIS